MIGLLRTYLRPYRRLIVVVLFLLLKNRGQIIECINVIRSD